MNDIIQIPPKGGSSSITGAAIDGTLTANQLVDALNTNTLKDSNILTANVAQAAATLTTDNVLIGQDNKNIKASGILSSELVTTGLLASELATALSTYLDKATYDPLSIAQNVFDADYSYLNTLGTSTYSTVQQWSDNVQSAGVISGGIITSDGLGEINVSQIECIIKTTDSDIGSNLFFTKAPETGIALTDESVNYIQLDYNSGTPQILVSTISSANGHTIFNLGKVFKESTNLDIINSGLQIYDFFKRVQQHHVEEANLHFVSGAKVSASGTRNIAITAGVLYAGLNRILTDDIDTSGSDTFEYYYYNGSAWIESDQSQIDNTNYNNIASGLTELTSNRYGVHWVYKGSSDNSYVIYGQGDYTLAQAEAAQPPATLPDHVSEMGVLRAKIIIQKSDSTFLSIENVSDVSFTPNTPAIHNELSGLQGGTTDEYYHLTNAQVGLANNALQTTATSLVSTSFFLDQDDMSGDDATKVASQQSIKAYVDGKARTASEWIEVKTYSIQGEIKVPSGSTDVIPPIVFRKGANEVIKLTSLEGALTSGTNCVVYLQKSDGAGGAFSAVTDFTLCTLTTNYTNPTLYTGLITISDGEVLQVFVTAVSGTPESLSLNLGITHTVTLT